MNYFVYISLVFFLVSTSYADDRIRVVDRDIKDKGLECDIKIEQKDGNIVKASYTNIDGYLELELVCNKLEKVIFVPKGDYYSVTFDCPLNIKIIRLSSISYQRNLIANAEYRYSIGDYGTSAFAYSDAAARLRNLNASAEYRDLIGEYGIWAKAYVKVGTELSEHDESAAIAISTKVYKATGKLLDVERPIVFDVNQQKNVISPELKWAIIKFQKKKGLKETGKIDFSTLKASSKEDLPVLLFNPPSLH